MPLDFTEIARWTTMPGAYAVVSAGDGVAVADPAAGVLVYDPDSGEPTAAHVGAVRALAVREPTRDEDLWLCGDAGLLHWDPATPDAEVVDAEPCMAVTADADEVVAASASRVMRRTDTGPAEEIAGLVPGERPLLALADGRLAFANAGDVQVAVVEDETRLVDAGGAVGAVGAVSRDFAWTIPGFVMREDGDATALAGETGAFAAGELDGDHEPDVVVPDGEVVHVLPGRGGEGVDIVVGVPVSAVAVRDVPGTCDVVLVLTPDDLRVFAATPCGATVDTDGDGWTPADGDCDDHDRHAFPGADDPCDAIDEDCDGLADPGVITFASTSHAVEGGNGDVFADVADCEGAWRFDWDLGSTRLATRENTTSENWLSLELLDDGRVPVTLTVSDASGNVLGTVDASFDVANVPPVRWTPDYADGCGSSEPFGAVDGEQTFYVGQTLTDELSYEDVAADPITLTVAGGPPNLTVDGTTLRFVAGPEDVGDWDVTLTASDGDGGTATDTVTLHVRPAWERGCGGCCCPTGSSLGAALAFAAARRRPSRPRTPGA